MSHEKSETVKIGKRWFNRDLRGARRILGNKKGYATMKEAITAAERRSRDFKLPRRKPRRKK